MQPDQLQAKLRDFEDLCRQKGIPLTVQRVAIFKAVLQRDDHPTADQVFEMVKQRIPQLSRTTVYRVLDALAELGLVQRVFPTGTARFDGNVRRHHHLVCRLCGKIIDLEDQTLDQLPLPTSELGGFEIDDFSIHFAGSCAACRRTGA